MVDLSSERREDECTYTISYQDHCQEQTTGSCWDEQESGTADPVAQKKSRFAVNDQDKTVDYSWIDN